MAKKKAKVIKAKVKAVKVRAIRVSKGALFPWQVHSVCQPSGKHSYNDEFKTKRDAQAFIDRCQTLLAPMIYHLVAPPMEY